MRMMREAHRNGAAEMPSRRCFTVFARRGFTVIELTAVIAIVAILVSLLCAALNQTKTKALRISCLENLKTLNLAWQMYSEDYEGQLPLNRSAAIIKDPRRFPEFSLSSNSWVSGNPKFDTSTAPIRAGTLFPYIRSVQPFRCALDDSRSERDPGMLRSRSYAMNAYLGGDEAMNPALNFNDLKRPSSTFVFIEEHERSRWESSFVVVPASKIVVGAGSNVSSWVSTPADRHEQGCNLTFADGHIEYWRWYSPKADHDTKMASTGGKHRDARDLNRLQAVVGQ